MTIDYVKGERKTLRDLGFDEKWLQERINEDPSILGLGDLLIIERERIQPTGGRLDFLMSEPEEGIRYEIEIMLGRLDESHIIRTIEYWDIERVRFPQLEHRAVIVAEEITSRFFNIISILNRAVPMIAIQLDPILVESKLLLHFTKVLDISELYGSEEDQVTETADRSYWERMSNPDSMAVVDRIVELISASGLQPRLTYKKGYIALNTTGKNFAWFFPRKTASRVYMHLLVLGEEREEWIQKLDDRTISARLSGKEMKMTITSKNLEGNEDIIKELFQWCEASSRNA